MIAEEIIQQAEKLKLKQSKRDADRNGAINSSKLIMTMTLSDMLSGYQKVMDK